MLIHEMTPEQKVDYAGWLAERPPHVRALAERFPPWHLYKLRNTEQRILIVAIFEDETLRIYVSPEHNPTRIHVGHQVFGIKPEDIVELPESERDVIAAEVEAMKGLEKARELAIAIHWSPEGIEESREFIRQQKSRE